MEIHFDKMGQIAGARTENYLLEKSRVVFQTPGERNYHVFYMLCVGSLKESLQMGPDLNHYRYLNQSGCLTVAGMDDAKEFDEVLDAMNCLGFSESDQRWIFETVAAVLLLGNLTFKPNEKDFATIANPEILTRIATFLGVSATDLDESLISRWFVIRGQDPTKIPFKPEEAIAAADACAKAVYGRLFDWIVQRVNQAMVVPQGTISYIGVLDIFGFEIFETNSFEQLCINFANEKLQQHFNEYTFKLEESVYRSEEIKFFHIEFIDNQPILDMIEKKPNGLLEQLDEEIRMPKGTDETWYNKICRDFEKTKHFTRVVKRKGHFVVSHYAGTVPYDSKDFLDKNRDSLWPDILKCLEESKNPKTSSIFPGEQKKGRVPSLGGQFRGQLNNLMEKLRSTEPSYIRCVKPNSLKQPDMFDSVMSLQQLRYAGVFEAIKIRQQGYPFRLTHLEWLRRYKCLSLRDGGWMLLKTSEEMDQIREILDITKQDFSDVQIGKTMVLYRAGQQRVMELLRNLSLERVCLVLQKWLRGCFARRFRSKLAKSQPPLKGALATGTSLDEATAAMEFAETTVGTYNRLFPFKTKEWLECQELKRQLVERKRVTDACDIALSLDPESNFADLEGTIQSGIAIEDYPGTPDQFLTFQKTKEMYDLTVNRRECRKELIRATEAAERRSLEIAILRAGELNIPDTSEIGPAKEMVARCVLEEAICEEMKAAQSVGGMLVYSAGKESIETKGLEEMCQKAIDFGMKTAEGCLLVKLSQYLTQLRKALQKQIWEGYCDWPEVVALLENPLLPEEEEEFFSVTKHPEISWGFDELQFRARLREVHAPLHTGVEELNEGTIENFLLFIDTTPFIVSGKDQQRRMKKIEEELYDEAKRVQDQIVNSRVTLEGAIASKNEDELKKAVEVAVALPVDDLHAVDQLEPLVQVEIILAMKFHLDYISRVELSLLLDEQLSKATAAQVKSSSESIFEVTKQEVDEELTKQSDALQAALDRASKIHLVSDSVHNLVEQATALLNLRKCLMKRNWEEIDTRLNAVVTTTTSCVEINLAKDEIAGRTAAKDCLQALHVAVEEVANPSDNATHPSESTLTFKLAYAEKLELQDLPDVIAGREMLEHIHDAQNQLNSSMKFHIDYNKRVEPGLILDDKLSQATVAKVISLSTGEPLEVQKADLLGQLQTQSAALEKALQHAAQIQLSTRLIIQGKALLELRQCLLAQDWESLETKLTIVHSLEIEGPELSLAKDEIAGRATAADCLNALKVAVTEVSHPTDEATHPSEVALDSRLAQVAHLELQDLPEIVSARQMLNHIRSTQEALNLSMQFGIDYGRRLEVGLILDDDLAESAEARISSLTTGEEISVTKARIIQELTTQSDALDVALKRADEVEFVTRTVIQGRALLEIRQCLLNRDWSQIDSLLSAALSVKVVGPETNLAKDEMAGRSTASECLEALAAAIAAVATPSEDFDHTSEGVLDSRLAQAERLEMKDLPEIVSAREMLDHIRSSQFEITDSMKFHVDYGHRIEPGMILDDHMCQATLVKIVSLSIGTEIEIQKADILDQLKAQSQALEAALQHAHRIQLVTRLVVQGKALLDLRKCLLDQDWENIETKLDVAIAANIAGAEINLAKDEIAGRVVATECLAGLRVAVEEVVNPSEDFGHPSEGPLESGLAQAERLEMQNLPEIVAGRDMLEHIRNVRKELEASMKYQVDYGRRVDSGMVLDDHLCRATTAKVTSLSSGAPIELQKADILFELQKQSDDLEAALQHADQIQLVTRLVLQGRALLALRRCLLAQDWETVEGHLNAALDVHISGPEINLAKDEIAGRAVAAECLNDLQVAVTEVTNPSPENAHPSESTLDSKLAQADFLELQDLPEVVSGREMLENIRNTRKELQIGLDLTGYADFIPLAEEFLQLYEIFAANTQQLTKALEMATSISYVTKETVEAQALMNELTILWYFQEDLQSGGYYEGAKPTRPPQETVVLEPATSHYTDYCSFPTVLGAYIFRKVYYVLTIRQAISNICEVPDEINGVVATALTEIGCPSTPELVSAETFMNQLNAARAALPEAEEKVREDLLIEAVKMCDDLFYDNADVQRVRTLRDLVIELNEESRKALWVLDKERMKAVLARANEIRLATIHLEYIQHLLDLGPMDWLKFEIKKAKELGDENRKIRLSIEMKDLTLTQFANIFGLNTLKNMRSSENYASQKLLSMDRKKLAQGMMSYSKTPAHTSLIDFSQLVHETDTQGHKLVQQLIKDSTRTFKNIMGFMGDKKYPDPISLVQETIQMCLDQPMLRSEVYLQTIKQITGHPIAGNKKRGFELLAVWCWQFPPQPDLDNILETYLRGVPEKSISYLGRLRDVTFQGSGTIAPSGSQIEQFIRDFFSSPPKRSSYEEDVAVIADVPYTDEFGHFENKKSLFQLDDEDARLRVA